MARFPPPPEPAPLAVNDTYTPPGDEEVGAKAAWFAETFPMQFGGQTVEYVQHVAINKRELFVVALGWGGKMESNGAEEGFPGPMPDAALPGR